MQFSLTASRIQLLTQGESMSVDHKTLFTEHQIQKGWPESTNHH